MAKGGCSMIAKDFDVWSVCHVPFYQNDRSHTFLRETASMHLAGALFFTVAEQKRKMIAHLAARGYINFAGTRKCWFVMPQDFSPSLHVQRSSCKRQVSCAALFADETSGFRARRSTLYYCAEGSLTHSISHSFYVPLWLNEWTGLLMHYLLV